MRVSRAERARQLVAVVSVAVMTPAFSVASAAPSETGPVSFVQQLSPLIPIIAAGLGGLVGLLSGIFLERGKAQRADQRLFLETRMRLWLDTASGFSAYLLSWSRLIAIARHEQSSEGLSELEQERKNTYVEERNRARQQLYCCMDQAFLFFSSDVLSKMTFEHLTIAIGSPRWKRFRPMRHGAGIRLLFFTR